MKHRKPENLKIKIKNYIDKQFGNYYTDADKDQLKEIIYKDFETLKNNKSGISINMFLDNLHYEIANYMQKLESQKNQILNDTAK